jgi:hypothetical protein
MGFLDKIKSAKNAVTGGAAKVYLDLEVGSFGEPIQVRIKAESQGSNVKYSRIYLEIEGVEEVEVPDVDVVYERDNSHVKRERVYASHKSLELDITVADSGVLAENESGEWVTEVQLPENALNTFYGRYTKHYYRILAGIDCFGNDPDSGWKEIRFQ